MADVPAESAAARPASRPKTLFDKMAYGFGSVAFGVKDNGFSYLLLFYYSQVVGVPAGLVGSALLCVLCVDAVVDPIIGYVSDNTRSRWGRRHPFMYAAALPVGILYLALWAPPTGWSDQALFVYLLVVASAMRACMSLYEIPSTSLVTDLSTDYDQRTSFLSFRYFFGWWGGLTMNILAFSVFLRPTAEEPVGQLNAAGYLQYGTVAALLMVFAILVSAMATHRHIPSFAKAPPKRPLNVQRVVRELRETLGHRAFLVMAGSAFFGYAAAGLAASMLTYFRTYFWELTGPQIGLLTAGNFGSTLLALFLAPWLSKTLGKKGAAIAVVITVIATGQLVYIARYLGIMPPNGSDALIAVLFCSSFLASCLTMMSGTLTGSMFADVVEDSELTTGRRNDGIFFSANSFVAQVVSGLGLFLAGVVLQLARFPADARPGEVPDSTLFRMMFTEVGIVIGLQTAGLIFLFLYPITRARHRANLERLNASRAELSRAAEVAERSHAPRDAAGAATV